jgi:hypothetical protein
VNATDVVRTRLLACAPVTALVSTRVYALVIPEQPTLPAIRVQRISQDQPMHLRGPIGMYTARVQVDSIATTKAAADALDAAVLGNCLGSEATGLGGWYGTISSTRVHAIKPAGVRESYEAGALRQYKIMRDFEVVFEGDA